MAGGESMVWRTGKRRLTTGEHPLIMGILNVTPDSFSDGGRFRDPERAVEHALEMEAEGADIIDIGGESTRPGARPVPLEEERRRVLPVIENLAARSGLPLSIDTRKPELASEAIERGVSIVNDVGAADRDPRMLRILRETGAGYICLHMQGAPASMQRAPAYEDVVREIAAFLAESLDLYRREGIDPLQVAFDVGIGFGKTTAHNLRLLHEMKRFASLGRPVVLGVSRKSFMGRILDLDHRTGGLFGSLACACRGWQDGVSVFRVHDVGPTVQALAVWRAIEGCDVLESD